MVTGWRRRRCTRAVKAAWYGLGVRFGLGAWCGLGICCVLGPFVLDAWCGLGALCDLVAWCGLWVWYALIAWCFYGACCKTRRSTHRGTRCGRLSHNGGSPCRRSARTTGSGAGCRSRTFTSTRDGGVSCRRRHSSWVRTPRLSPFPRLDTIPDSRAVGREGRCPNVLPDGPNKHYVLEIHETGFVKAQWFRPLAQFQKSRVHPLFNGAFARQDESAQGAWGFQATNGQVTNAGETPSCGEV